MEMNQELLLKQAKKMYPVGTEYRPAHLIPSINNVSCIVMEYQTLSYHDNIIYLLNPNDTVWDKDRNGHTYSQVLYDNGKWAEILNDYEGWK